MISLKKAIGRSLLLAVGLLAVASSTKSLAGSPRFTVEYTDMTPNEFSDQTSKQCSNLFKGRLGAALDEVVYVDEAERRRRARSDGGDTPTFMSWGPKEITLDDFTFAVAVDCRPDKQQLDVLLVGHKGSVTFRLRGVRLGSKRLSWLADDIATRAETIFWR